MHHKRYFAAAPFRVMAVLLTAGVFGLIVTACGKGESPDEPMPALPTLQTGDETPASSVAIGEPAPDFTLPASDGGQVSLASYKGQQPVLLFFHMAAG
jgi:cytochrome oxidase Cu insertion factor (SCO1/SenC/PrrC family)